MTSIKLSDIAESRVNNLNLMRFIAAVFVIISHCYVVTLGGDAGDFICGHTSGRLTFGGMAVGLFFVFGGFLIARSCEHHNEAKVFFKQRVLRLFPELIFVVVMVAFVLGPCLSSLSPVEYFTNPQPICICSMAFLFWYMNFREFLHTTPWEMRLSMRLYGRCLLNLAAMCSVLSDIKLQSLIRNGSCSFPPPFFLWSFYTSQSSFPSS